MLGHGGFGFVYKERHLEFEVVVDLREYLRSTLALCENERARSQDSESSAHFENRMSRFLTVAERLSAVERSPKVVTPSELSRVNVTAYAVIDFKDSLPLPELLRKRGASERPFAQAD